MAYYIKMQGQVIGPMDPQQLMAYNVNPNVAISKDGIYWSPLYTFPELMQLYQQTRNNNGYAGNNYGGYQQMSPSEVSSKKTLCGIMALLFGTLGIQYFILGKVGGGFITILLSLITCGLWEIVVFIQGIMMLCMSDQDFKRKYIDSTSVLPLF